MGVRANLPLGTVLALTLLTPATGRCEPQPYAALSGGAHVGAFRYRRPPV
jgi:hypothetical protein